MSPAPEPLPNDIAALRAMLVAAWADPGFRQILAQAHQPGTIRGRKSGGRLSLIEVVELHLQGLQPYQLLVPTPLPLAGNQAIVGIDSIILAACPVDGVPGRPRTAPAGGRSRSAGAGSRGC